MADVTVNPLNQNPKELLSQGIKAYVLQDYDGAVEALSQASQILVDEHGDDLHESLGDVYLYYGKSLLALSRAESDALGDAVPKNDDEEEGDDDEGDEEEGAGEDENQENDDNEKKDGEKKEKVEEKVEAVNGDAPGPSVEKPHDETTEEKGEDEPADLQVAWEVLELAKKIFQEKGDEGRKFLAETYVVLGEISLEGEMFESAINDMKQGLEIQKTLYSTDSRTVAETLYKLGIAYSTDSQIEEAINCFNDSLSYLKNRINVLEKTEDKKDSVDEEIKEIQGLIPEILEKITDMKNYKEEAIKNLASALSEPKAGESSGSSKQATDISHLVKRKRKVEESPNKPAENTDCPAKRPSP